MADTAFSTCVGKVQELQNELPGVVEASGRSASHTTTMLARASLHGSTTRLKGLPQDIISTVPRRKQEAGRKKAHDFQVPLCEMRHGLPPVPHRR